MTTSDTTQRGELFTEPVNVDEAWESGYHAGYAAAKPRIITTVEGLTALFEGAYGTDADGLLWKIDGGTCAWINIDDGADEEYRDSDIKLPFTLLSPEDEATR